MTFSSLSYQYNEIKKGESSVDNHKLSILNNMSKVSLLTVILACVNAIFWTFKFVFDFVNHRYQDSNFSLILGVICALIWILSFIVNYRRYHSNKDDKL